MLRHASHTSHIYSRVYSNQPPVGRCARCGTIVHDVSRPSVQVCVQCVTCDYCMRRVLVRPQFGHPGLAVLLVRACAPCFACLWALPRVAGRPDGSRADGPGAAAREGR